MWKKQTQSILFSKVIIEIMVSRLSCIHYSVWVLTAAIWQDLKKNRCNGVEIRQIIPTFRQGDEILKDLKTFLENWDLTFTFSNIAESKNQHIQI